MPDPSTTHLDESLARMLDCVSLNRTYPKPISPAKAQFLMARLHELGYIELHTGVNDGHGGKEDVWVLTLVGSKAREVYCHEPPSEDERDTVKRFEVELEKAKQTARNRELAREHEKQSASLSSNFPPGETATKTWDELDARATKLEAALEHVRQYLPPFCRTYVDAALRDS
jgi:hypothetical protein